MSWQFRICKNKILKNKGNRIVTFFFPSRLSIINSKDNSLYGGKNRFASQVIIGAIDLSNWARNSEPNLKGRLRLNSRRYSSHFWRHFAPSSSRLISSNHSICIFEGYCKINYNLIICWVFITSVVLLNFTNKYENLTDKFIFWKTDLE